MHFWIPQSPKETLSHFFLLLFQCSIVGLNYNLQPPMSVGCLPYNVFEEWQPLFHYASLFKYSNKDKHLVSVLQTSIRQTRRDKQLFVRKICCPPPRTRDQCATLLMWAASSRPPLCKGQRQGGEQIQTLWSFHLFFSCFSSWCSVYLVFTVFSSFNFSRVLTKLILTILLDFSMFSMEGQAHGPFLLESLPLLL